MHQKKVLQEMKTYFTQHYQDWESIYAGLNLIRRHCALMNKYFLGEALEVEGEQIHLIDNVDEPSCNFKIFVNERFTTPYAFKNNRILPYYLLDMASLLPVLCLEVKHDDQVLDMCAAPGGKSIAIMQLLSKSGQLVCNEYSKSRLNRLHKVIKEYIPNAFAISSNLNITDWCGTVFGEEEQNTFDKILVDAPCSSERHVIQKEFQYGGWSIKKMVENSKLQTQLLCSALNSVKVGGDVVYSTCSVSPIENDTVVETVIESNKNFRTITDPTNMCVKTIDRFPPKTFNFVRTKYGLLVFPNDTCNWGPIYFSKLTKISDGN